MNKRKMNDKRDLKQNGKRNGNHANICDKKYNAKLYVLIKLTSDRSFLL